MRFANSDSIQQTSDEAVLDPKLRIGFVEIHIEQGPVLEAEGSERCCGDVGSWARRGCRLNSQGMRTTRGRRRCDFDTMRLSGAAEWITRVESMARETEGLVATVGKVNVKPNAGNVVPGMADVSLDRASRARCEAASLL